MDLVDLEPCGVLLPQSGVEPGSPALQGVFLTPEPPVHGVLLFPRKCLSTKCLTVANMAGISVEEEIAQREEREGDAFGAIP